MSKSSAKKNRFLIIYGAIIALYAVFYFVQSIRFANIVFGFLGILMIFAPGFIASELLNLKKLFRSPFNLIISLPLAFSISTVLAVGSFGHGQLLPWLLTIVVNLIAITIYYFLYKSVAEDRKASKGRLWLYLGMIFPFLIFFICLKIYPYFVGDDTYFLVDYVREGFVNQRSLEMFMMRRPFFIPFVNYLRAATGFSLNSIFILVIPLMTLIGTLLPIALIRDAVAKRWWIIVWGLVFLASPYLFFQIEYAIPQSIVIMMSFAVLILSYYAILNRDAKLLILALLFSTISAGYHELGLILVVCASVGLLIFAIRSLKEDLKTGIRKILLALIVIFPYLVVLKFFDKLKGAWVFPSMLINNLPEHFTFRLWYVNYYLNPDGIVFSYPGLKGLLWYFYLGLLIAVVALVVLLIVWIKRFVKKQEFIAALPLLLFITIFFFVAEIYPRIAKVAFLPERAWIFFTIGSVIFLSFAIRRLDKLKLTRTLGFKILTCVVLASILIGCAGSVYLADNRGILVSKNEAGAIKYLSNLPDSSLLISTQTHNKSLCAFAQRDFIAVTPKRFDNLHDLFSYSKEQVEASYLKQYVAKKVLYVDLQNNEYIDDAQPVQYRQLDMNNIYFIYSTNRFEKTAFVGNPNFFQMNDIENRDLLVNNKEDLLPVFSENGVVIYKVGT